MSAFKNDGSVKYGAEVLTIGTLVPGGTPSISGGVAYIADSLSFNTPGKVIEQNNEIGEPGGWVGVTGFITGSAQVQYATTSTAAPVQGQHFITSSRSGTAEVYCITDVDQPLTSDGEAKVNISYRKCYNTAS
jgi:hypothetical protein